MVRKKQIEPLEVHKAVENLEIKEGEIVALVGGGGKSTLLRALGELHGRGTILTTTTKMGSDQTGEANLLISPSEKELADALGGNAPVMIWDRVKGEKAFGVDPSLPKGWLPEATRVIVEATAPIRTRRIPLTTLQIEMNRSSSLSNSLFDRLKTWLLVRENLMPY